MTEISVVEKAATIFFGLAILHSFFVNFFSRLSSSAAADSVKKNIFRALGEVEIVFGLWAGIFVAFVAATSSPAEAGRYLQSRNYTEPVFVFVIMVVCATRPILTLASKLMDAVTAIFLAVFREGGLTITAGRRDTLGFIVMMSLGPLLGSLITEPAAMTLIAMMLLKRYYQRTESLELKYAMTGLLFVNISIGGTLTSFAAPPVLMVARAWSWDSLYLLKHFGWKAALGCVTSTLVIAFLFRESLLNLKPVEAEKPEANVPWPLMIIHLVFLALIVLASHDVAIFFGIFLVFMAMTAMTKNQQGDLKLKAALFVGIFLGGLVVLAGPQGWWIQPLLLRVDGLPLFASAASLTALTDNAALTYLGSLVPTLSEDSKYALVAGAVTGGGLTVIANAPNPAGHGILSSAFGESGISPIRLFRAALLPTLIAGAFFWVFRGF